VAKGSRFLSREKSVTKTAATIRASCRAEDADSNGNDFVFIDDLVYKPTRHRRLQSLGDDTD
jgi:hypothetical protein